MKKYLTFALVMLIAGCATIGVTPLSQTTYPPKPKGSPIDVYTSKDKVTKPYEELALIDVTGTMWSDGTVASAITDAKAKALTLGADAIIIQSTGRGTVAYQGSASPVGTAEAIAIKYK